MVISSTPPFFFSIQDLCPKPSRNARCSRMLWGYGVLRDYWDTGQSAPKRAALSDWQMAGLSDFLRGI